MPRIMMNQIVATAVADEGARELIQKVSDPDATARMKAAQSAGPEGSAAVAPLAQLLTGERGVAKAADEALRRIAHHSARPGARKEAKAVSVELCKLAGSEDAKTIRMTAIRLLLFTGGDESVPTLAKLMKEPEYREDARLTLTGIPGRAATHALESVLKNGEEDFKPNLELSLSRRASSFKTVGTEK